MKMQPHTLALLALVALRPAAGQVTVSPAYTFTDTSISVRLDAPGVPVNPGLWGIFYEEINHAGDGGLYAELVQNRAFEEGKPVEGGATVDNHATTPNGWRYRLHTTPLQGWQPLGNSKLEITTDQPLNPQTSRSLKLQTTAPNEGVINTGYWGMNITAGQTYDLSFYLRSNDSAPQTITARLESPDGSTILAAGHLTASPGPWKRYALSLTANKSDPKARLILAFSNPGTVHLDVVSLFPRDTFKSRPNGMRRDLAEMLVDLKPGFLRFPGGCVVEGCTLDNRIQWKNTIGPIENRPGRWDLWGYHTPEGLGFHEYLQLCEDLNAAPMYVVNVGMSCQARHAEIVDNPEALAPFVQDTMDALEYAMGPADSTWGKLRAAAGHPAPFKIKYVEIGNENGGPVYARNYRIFYDAIKAKYPGIRTIADERIRNQPMEMIDEHYYVAPESFFATADRYDAYDRSGPKIYIGEYAVNRDVGAGNLLGALSEAAFMTGIERNADVVEAASYAPLFENVNDREWATNLIRFDSSRVAGRSSYWVQQLFSHHRPDRTVPISLTQPPAGDTQINGQVGVGTWTTQAEFKDFKVTAGDKTLLDKLPDTITYDKRGGQWTAANNTLTQSNNGTERTATFGDPAWSKYSYSLKARKTAGSEGFLILLHSRGRGNAVWWNIGGWSNTEAGVEQDTGGSRHAISPRIPFKVETNRWYDLRVDVDGPHISCYLDGQLLQTATIRPPRQLFASAGIENATGDLILKIVNRADHPLTTTIDVPGLKPTPAQCIYLTSANPTDENTPDHPNLIKPQTVTLPSVTSTTSVKLPASSLTILRIPTR